MLRRNLNLSKLLDKSRSVFIFGPRGVGKTSLVQEFLTAVPDKLEIDLLSLALYRRYLDSPSAFRADVENALTHSRTALFVFVDEIQKLPGLLDEVHSLLEKHRGKLQFILTGSSARKLKRGGANLLAGRALTLKLHPLTISEGTIDLSRALQTGTLPGIYLDVEAAELRLQAYVETYLREEVLQEALVRKSDAFLRFLDLAGQANGEPINFKALAGQARIADKTAREYFSILVDTLICHELPAWDRSVRRQLATAPKYYFFDCGVLNAIRGELKTELRQSTFRYGRLFETFVINQILAQNDYHNAGFRAYHWRTQRGAEVDLVLARNLSSVPIAIEIKSSDRPDESDCKALHLFAEEHPKARLFCVSNSPHDYKLGKVKVVSLASLESIILDG